jgi:hypothetical protein
MSDDAGSSADRDAFFAALGRVFQEYGDVSKGYGICDVARLAGRVGADVENDRIIVGTGGIVTVGSKGGGLVEGQPGECIVIVPTVGPDGLPGRQCIVFEGP